MKSVSVFGVTGSIGCTAVKILLEQSDVFSVDVVTGGSNVELLAQTAVQLQAKHAVIADDVQYEALKTALIDYPIQVSAGRQALMDAADRPVDISLQGIVGFAGVECSLRAAKSANTLALANKESLVCAGPLLNSICAENDTKLLPVDSEHSAIFQCLLGESADTIERVILTASGGPFLHTPLSDLRDVTADQAAAHPRWSMGKRISIDSASMFNKAMELIETKELFGVPTSKLEVIVQPQSIIHSMVGFRDGAIMAHLGPADMAGAIGYAMNYPDRVEAPLERLDFAKLGKLEFAQVDTEKFPAIDLAFQAMEQGGLSGAVFNASKEQALDLFLQGDIGFLDMALCVQKALNDYGSSANIIDVSLDAIIDQDRSTRAYVQKIAKGLSNV